MMTNKKKKGIGAAFEGLEKPVIDNESPVKNIISEPPAAPSNLLPGYGVARVETKSKRVQLTFTPSLYKALKARADAAGLSFNEYMTQLGENELRKEMRTI